MPRKRIEPPDEVPLVADEIEDDEESLPPPDEPAPPELDLAAEGA